MEKKAQSSMEFTIIFAIGFGLIVLFSGIFFHYFNGEKATIDKLHMEKIGNEIISNIEKIYFLGKENRVTIGTKFPEGITNITIEHMNISTLKGNFTYDILNIEYFDNSKSNNLEFTTREHYIRFNCSDCIHNDITNISYYNMSSFSGFKRLRFESQGDWVDVDFIIAE